MKNILIAFTLIFVLSGCDEHERRKAEVFGMFPGRAIRVYSEHEGNTFCIYDTVSHAMYMVDYDKNNSIRVLIEQSCCAANISDTAIVQNFINSEDSTKRKNDTVYTKARLSK